MEEIKKFELHQKLDEEKNQAEKQNQKIKKEKERFRQTKKRTAFPTQVMQFVF